MGQHPLTSRFMHGVSQLRPICRPCIPSWDLSVIFLNGKWHAGGENQNHTSLVKNRHIRNQIEIKQCSLGGQYGKDTKS